MKISELLQESTTPFTWIKDLDKEFKALATKCGVTLVAGMGWPGVRKDGAWFGGGIKNKGESNDIRKVKMDDVGALPVEIKAKAAIQLIAKKLESLIADGHTVKIAAAAQPSVNLEEVKAGEALQKLTAGFVMAEPPGNIRPKREMLVASWFVSLPPDLAALTSVRFDITLRSDDFPPTGGDKTDPDQYLFITLAGSLPIEEAKKLEKDWTKFWRVNGFRVEDKTYRDLPATDEGGALVADVVKYLEKMGVQVPKNMNLNGRQYMGITLKILTKNAKMIDMAEFAAVLRKHI